METGYLRLCYELSHSYHFPESEFEYIEKAFYAQKLRKGDKFVSEGEVPIGMAFVVSGLFKYYCIDKNGNERIKNFIKENDFIASYASFIKRQPSPYYIEAIEPSEILVVTYEDYSKSLENNLSWQSVARQYAEKMFMMKELRETSLLKDNAQERYLQFVEENPDILHRVKQKYIASYLGIAPESLSRIINH